MLAKVNRFVFNTKPPKNTLNSQSFSIRYDRNEGGLKVGVVVSKKVDKRATVRNRIKRVIMEAVRKNLPVSSNFTLIFYVKVYSEDSKSLSDEVKLKVEEIASSQSSSQ